MVTVLNTGFIISFIQLMNLLSYIIIVEKIIYILIFSAVGTVICGSLLLLTQITIKGFFAANSILNTGFILLAVISLNCLVLPLDRLQLI
jgi:NADH:ubiquinone oxidoreductase subunit 2 (subunit N)